MLRNAFTAILFLLSANCFAQQDYFLLIQADNSQPFYATINGKAMSSSEAGRLIIPKLRDTVYYIGIAFPQDKFPEQKFSIAINKKDQSFQLKNMGEKGWALFNNATLELKMADKTAPIAARPSNAGSAKKEDAFARLMAGVVNDTSVMYNSYIEEEPKKEAENVKNIKSPTVKTDSILADNKKKNLTDTLQKQTALVTAAVQKAKRASPKTDSASNGAAMIKSPLYRQKDTVAIGKKSSFVKKLNERKTDSSLHLVYADILNKGGIDTVDVFIMIDKEQSAAMAQKKDTAKKEEPHVSGKEVAHAKDTVQSIAIGKEKESKSPDNIKKDTVKAERKEIGKMQTNQDCKAFSSDYDIDKLRIKTLGISNDDDKIIAARNVFKVKCFSVKQVAALSEVFRTDEGKYKLFDAVYAHVSDISNFIQLQQLLTDSYYINRFKAMIR
jgi:uncharacterized protein DUF4476